jgi:hypothetical protein
MKAQSINRTEKKNEKPSKAEKVYKALERQRQRLANQKKETAA